MAEPIDVEQFPSIDWLEAMAHKENRPVRCREACGCVVVVEPNPDGTSNITGNFCPPHGNDLELQVAVFRSLGMI